MAQACNPIENEWTNFLGGAFNQLAAPVARRESLARNETAAWHRKAMDAAGGSFVSPQRSPVARLVSSPTAPSRTVDPSESPLFSARAVFSISRSTLPRAQKEAPDTFPKSLRRGLRSRGGVSDSASTASASNTSNLAETSGDAAGASPSTSASSDRVRLRAARGITVPVGQAVSGSGTLRSTLVPPAPSYGWMSPPASVAVAPRESSRVESSAQGFRRSVATQARCVSPQRIAPAPVVINVSSETPGYTSFLPPPAANAARSPSPCAFRSHSPCRGENVVTATVVTRQVSVGAPGTFAHAAPISSSQQAPSAEATKPVSVQTPVKVLGPVAEATVATARYTSLSPPPPRAAVQRRSDQPEPANGDTPSRVVRQTSGNLFPYASARCMSRSPSPTLRKVVPCASARTSVASTSQVLLRRFGQGTPSLQPPTVHTPTVQTPSRLSSNLSLQQGSFNVVSVDAAVCWCLSNLPADARALLSVKRVGDSLYEIDGRRVSMLQRPDGGVVAVEHGIEDADGMEPPLKEYLEQAARVALALSGSAVKRAPPERRLTFLPPGQDAEPMDDPQPLRLKSMRLACEQASLREQVAKAQEASALRPGLRPIAVATARASKAAAAGPPLSARSVGSGTVTQRASTPEVIVRL
eukprot:TRINITY_DN73201_c0_g1_i1.p1 TRINITY_DN73201_c0_g1~~TRINITY_DN73201_c0_g1_i1.p1  ORF type:complete len:642 (+),score=55.08 TRINITY_DN73201_c0_g1_i1:30-1955(+)